MAEVIPARDLATWEPWIHLVVNDVERALGRPVGKWNQAWVQWLLLIAYSIPTPLPKTGVGWGQAVGSGGPTRCANVLALLTAPRPGQGSLAAGDSLSR